MNQPESDSHSATPPAHWWAESAQRLAQQLRTDARAGLTVEQVQRSRSRFGRNTLGEIGATSLWTLLWESIKTPMMLLLLVIAGISLVLGQLRQATVMVFVVGMYVGIHLLNKARADRTMARLRDVQAPRTSVVRDGETVEGRVDEVVVGDILPLRAGTRVPADARLLDTAGLLVDEAALTGESAPVQKDAGAAIAPEAPLAERSSAVFAGTYVVDGQGTALVMAVGTATELGRVFELAARPATGPTPLQKEMDDLARTLALVAIGVSLLIPAVGLARGFDLQQMVLTWLSLTFLMVPGQPPIIIAMALALASLELARKQTIVRRLDAAESLGSISVVLSDKTGTLTENTMRLAGVLLPTGEILHLEDDNGASQPKWRRFFEGALPAIPEHSNDPTDVAMEEAARSLGAGQAAEVGRLVNARGFARTNAYRSMEYRLDGRSRVYVTGRPEFILERSSRRQTVEGTAEWSAHERRSVVVQLETQAAEGKHIAGYAYCDDAAGAEDPRELVFVGMALIEDPVRPEVPATIQRLSAAGIRTVIVSGDIPQTTAYVAETIGLGGHGVVTGAELQGQSEQELEAAAREVRAFARVTPAQKLQLVDLFRRLGETVAVTGDGINDAPALHAAHVGIAMGRKGTDVAKEAADLILTDDKLAHLPDGVAIGRKAYDNFRKGITYYLSAKAILLSIFVVPLLAGIPFPLAPIQIIFTELLMDLASSTIFVSEEAEPDVMRRAPRRQGRFLSRPVALRILRNMAGPSLAILAVYFGSLSLGYDSASARTAAFATWLLGHIFLAMNLKQETTPLLRQGILSNRFAAGWLLGMLVLVLAMTNIPIVRATLQTTALDLQQSALVVVGALAASLWIEIAKWIRLRQSLTHNPHFA